VNPESLQAALAASRKALEYRNVADAAERVALLYF